MAVAWPLAWAWPWSRATPGASAGQETVCRGCAGDAPAAAAARHLAPRGRRAAGPRGGSEQLIHGEGPAMDLRNCALTSASARTCTGARSCAKARTYWGCCSPQACTIVSCCSFRNRCRELQHQASPAPPLAAAQRGRGARPPAGPGGGAAVGGRGPGPGQRGAAAATRRRARAQRG